MEATDVLVSLAHFSDVTVEDGPGGHVARIGAGATLEKVLSDLQKTEFSLPTLGAITRQTIAGATATATHGTGNARGVGRFPASPASPAPPGSCLRLSAAFLVADLGEAGRLVAWLSRPDAEREAARITRP